MSFLTILVLSFSVIQSNTQAAPPDGAVAMNSEMEQLKRRVAELETPPVVPPTPSSEPFAWGDFTWLNGNSRQHTRLLDSPYFTPQIDVDVNYTYSFLHPNDNTVVGSTALARNNEMNLNYLGFGGDLHYRGARARLWMQFGTRSTVVPRNDFSIQRGQFDLATVYRYLSEAYAGYHFDVMRGVNVDVGLFMSYVGLFSYMNFENWAYWPSFTSDNTPWFFNGMRIQMFPTDRLKVEFWVVNGWQTYAKFNDWPGLGVQVLYRPWEWLSFLASTYAGTDTANRPRRIRWHTDNSILLRYYHAPESFLSGAAFSVTFDAGLEHGDGVSAFGTSGSPAQNFLSAMAYNRLWFWNRHLGWTVGGGFIHNPGRYLVLLPSGEAVKRFDTSAGTRFDGWDISTTFDWMPLEVVTFRMELAHRETSVPYYAGPGGITSPDGYITTAVPDDWQPDLRKADTRIILATLFRF